MGQGGGCGSCEEKKSARANDDVGTLPQNDSSRIGKVIAVMSGKGGVGKSSVAALLACALSNRGFRTGVLDADVTGPSLPRMFGVQARPYNDGFTILPPATSTGIKIMSLNLLMTNEDDPVIWRGPLLAGVVKQFWTDVAWGETDYLIVDLPPGTGDVPLTVMQSLPLDGVIIVSSPQHLVAMIVSKAIKMARQMNVPILGLVENMSGAVCPHCGGELPLFGQGRGFEMAARFGIPFLGRLPLDPELSQVCDEGRIENYRTGLFINFGPPVPTN